VNILCLEEHKLRGDKVERNIRTLWKIDNPWFLEASPCKELEDMNIGAGKGSIALCFQPKTQPLILDK
jgi:hypothetical protein